MGFTLFPELNQRFTYFYRVSLSFYRVSIFVDADADADADVSIDTPPLPT